MRLGQIRFEHKLTAALFEGGMARPIPGYSTVELIRKALAEAAPLAQLAEELAIRHGEAEHPAIPINPVEVWACGCTYESCANFRDGEQIKNDSIYAHANAQDRPEIFFKGTARTCVGPGQPIGIRFDSKSTGPEPELAVVLGRRGEILGYTLANDVSAWDIERQNPLYMPQSKMYTASCALGPFIVSPDELGPIAKLTMTCKIERAGKEVFSGSVSLSRLRRRVEDLIEYLLRANPVPSGSVLLTGTGIVVPESAALSPEDIVTIEVPEIGELVNAAAYVN